MRDDKLKNELERKNQEVSKLKQQNKQLASRPKYKAKKKVEENSLGDSMFLDFFSFLKFG